MLLRDLTAIILGYLLGSIPFAHIVTSWRNGLNICQVGIGNPGARNVWHVVGPGWGTLVGVLDAAKGLAAVLLARALGASETGALLTGPAAILGHALPLYLRFQGGKGLATTFGVLLAWMPRPTLIGLILLAATQLFLRNLDRSIYVGAPATILLPLAFGYPWTMTLYALGLFCILWVRKLRDRPHQRRVWAASGWKDVRRSDWYGESPGDQEATSSLPESRDDR